MKKMLAVFVVTTAVLALLASCAAPTPAPPTVSELLDLGERYLLKLDYEQAVAQFLAVIEIEPMNARAYIGAAKAYIALGRTDDAIAVLERGYETTDDAGISAMLVGLTTAAIPTEVITEVPQDSETLAATQRGAFAYAGARVEMYYADGSLCSVSTSLGVQEDGKIHSETKFSNSSATRTVLYEGADERTLFAETYDLDGVLFVETVLELSTEGKPLLATLSYGLRYVYLYTTDGSYIGYDEYSDDTLIRHARYEDGKTVCYAPDGTMDFYEIYYDAEGNIVEFLSW